MHKYDVVDVSVDHATSIDRAEVNNKQQGNFYTVPADKSRIWINNDSLWRLEDISSLLFKNERDEFFLAHISG